MFVCRIAHTQLLNSYESRPVLGKSHVTGTVFVDKVARPAIYVVPDDAAALPEYVVAFYKG